MVEIAYDGAEFGDFSSIQFTDQHSEIRSLLADQLVCIFGFSTFLSCPISPNSLCQVSS